MHANKPWPQEIALACSEAIYFITTPRPHATIPIRAFSIQDETRSSLRWDKC
jgi:hypothetical protein